MELLVFITNHVDIVAPILAEFLEAEIKGATVVDCQGMLQELNASSVEPPPIFGMLRSFINANHEPGKMILAVLNKEDIEKARGLIHKFSGGLDAPNKGVLFALPVSFAEGV